MDLFENISEKNKQKILRLIEANTAVYKKDQTILSTLKNDNIIGIVLYGYLQIIKIDYNGNVTIIEKLEDNSIFGSMFSNISNQEYQLITKEETKIIIIEYDQILLQANNSPYYYQFIQNLLKLISTKINEKNERIEILTEKTIRNKLLKYFQIITKRNGSRTIYLPFTYTELAEYLSVDRSALMREIKNLKNDGIITTKGHKIYMNF